MRSFGSGGSADLNVMVSELKDMRESAKGFMNAQNSGNVDFFGIKQLLILRKKKRCLPTIILVYNAVRDKHCPCGNLRQIR